MSGNVFFFYLLLLVYLRGMESIVEDVEDDRETEGSPAKSQSCEDSRGCDIVRNSRRVNQYDGLSRCGHYQVHRNRCQTKVKCHNVYFERYSMLT